MKVAAAVLLLLSVSCAYADVYMHNPRGSNNRLDEANNNRRNANRLFDSQNNNAGGYNVGPRMYFYTGSVLTVEWTNQHGCGQDQPNTHCEMILQYACEDTLTDTVRDGTSTGRSNWPGPAEIKYGVHEPDMYYQQCKMRQRNKGLFTADQKVDNPFDPKKPIDRSSVRVFKTKRGATSTRQNRNGNRYGYECPEERDYYPYWHPTPWKDIAILTSDPSRCNYYKQESQNVKSKGNCTVPYFNNRRDCEMGFTDPKNPKNNIPAGVWQDAPAHGIEAPKCFPGAYSRDNHLGNGIDGYALTYNWTIPDDVHKRCVLRLRYNITTGDYDAWNINATWNKDKSPIKNNPRLDGTKDQMDFYYLKLAVNTAQFGRTFQDRSHTFEIRKRPANIPPSTMIWNVNVRGKRGNIVQVYPGVEYDFVPNVRWMRPDDLLHMQWTGSDTNPNGNDGQGKRGTDRSNVVQLAEPSMSYPMHKDDQTMLGSKSDPTFEDKFLHWATLAGGSTGLTYQPDEELNEGSPYFDGGLTKMPGPGKYYYMSSRNNNFSNRGQKAKIIVDAGYVAQTSYHLSGALPGGLVYTSEANGQVVVRTEPTSSSNDDGEGGLSFGSTLLIAAIAIPAIVLLASATIFMVMKKKTAPKVPPRPRGAVPLASSTAPPPAFRPANAPPLPPRV
eukprot:TRINITY_DN1547_c0_g1_i2.p1 TRINITY_DN1547_c0_g1~~TRINITY_DN1547_c0_g1_i2.p1  ORF type:complete len:669 (+),score=214.26 TRINITY_DN1547_c0_g1_i2:389-2395(+)